MPRKPDPARANAQERQRRWRERLRMSRTPEGSAVDIAISSAVTAYAAHHGLQRTLTPERREVIDSILAAARELLISEGYALKGTKRVLSRRFARWCRDGVIRDLIERSGLSKKG